MVVQLCYHLGGKQRAHAWPPQPPSGQTDQLRQDSAHLLHSSQWRGHKGHFLSSATLVRPVQAHYDHALHFNREQGKLQHLVCTTLMDKGSRYCLLCIAQFPIFMGALQASNASDSVLQKVVQQKVDVAVVQATYAATPRTPPQT